jgi:aminoglycoside phosphotransferase (APT) family kinase protein
VANERLKETTTELRPMELVGRGFTADVYAWGPGRVIKLFHEPGGHERAEREYRTTRTVHGAGLPAPAVYGLITIEDRQGIVFERLEGVSMLTHFQKTPWKMFIAIRQVADLQAQILATPGPTELPSLRHRLAARIESSEVLSATQKMEAQAALAALPDGTTTCHGDFHPENILFTARGPVVIDWGAATRGDPFGDVACTARLIQTAPLPPWTPGYMHQLLRCSRILLHRSYIKRCLQHLGGTREHIRRWEAPINAAATALRLPVMATTIFKPHES